MSSQNATRNTIPAGLRLSTLAFAAICALANVAWLAAQAPPAGQDDIVWHDSATIGIEGKGWTDTPAPYARLPQKAEGLVPKPVWDLGRHTAGLCIRFTTDAPSIQVRWTLGSPSTAMEHMPATGVSGVDLYVNDSDRSWRFVANGRPAGMSNVATFDVAPGKQHLLYLPLYNIVPSIQIGIPKNRTIAAAKPIAAKPIVFYGTSITQGGCASRPGMAYTAIVGRKLNVPVINLGFTGNGRMELALADLLAELDPSVYVLDCLWNMTPEQVNERVAPFVKRLRQSRPNTPILLAEDCSVGNITPTPKGVLLRSIYDKLKADGVTNLHFLSNSGMLGVDGEATVDGCHPTDLGMSRMADVFAKSLASLVQESQPTTNKP